MTVTPRLRESDLYAPVRDWLLLRGYEVHVEIFDCDIVALRDGLLTVVELKPCLTHELYHQCQSRSRWADFVYAAIGSEPRQSGGWRHAGFGLLVVRGDRVRERRRPKQQPLWWHKAHAYRLKRLAGRSPAMAHEVAGLPSCPALKQQRALRNTPAESGGE